MVYEHEGEWWDRDHVRWSARPSQGYLCEVCPQDELAVVETRFSDDDSSGGQELCDPHYQELRAQPHHNPERGFADEYVSLGAAL